MKSQKSIKTVQAEWMGETDKADKQEQIVVRECSCCFD